MKTICLESIPSSVIWGGIRYSDEDNIYTTLEHLSTDPLRDNNLTRFWKEVVPLNASWISDVLLMDNNIQIVANNGDTWIKDLYATPQTHPLLSKTWIIETFNKDERLNRYIAKSIIIDWSNTSLSSFSSLIQANFESGCKLVLKHSQIDWNGDGVYVIINDGSHAMLEQQLKSALTKFSKRFEWSVGKTFPYEFVVQEYIEDTIGEGSITFSIQNRRIENRWLVNNVVEWWEYFWSTNYFWYLTPSEITIIQTQIENDFLPLLQKLQQEWVRWNVWFDLLIKENEKGNYQVYILECNGIHRTTGSSIANSFWFNTKNRYFAGIPLSKAKLLEQYQQMDQNILLEIANQLQSFGTQSDTPQIMNLKCEGFEWWYPVLRIAASSNTKDELLQLFLEANLTNQKGTEYIKEIFTMMQSTWKAGSRIWNFHNF